MADVGCVATSAEILQQLVSDDVICPLGHTPNIAAGIAKYAAPEAAVIKF